VHGASGLFGSGLQGLFPSLHAGESGQQRRVNIKNAVGERSQKGLLHQAHKAGKANHIYMKRLQLFSHGLLHL
jgi:hypothetical protein